MAAVEESQLKKEVPQFQVGDQVEVHQRILEGEKERVQVFAGVVIARRGEGMREMFTVRRIVQGEGVERIFPLHSPRIAKVEVKRTGAVRRAKLYYLRKRVGKATRLRERRKGSATTASAAETKLRKTKTQSAVATEGTTGSKTSR
jgi:large subunit ribosomal protein L19